MRPNNPLHLTAAGGALQRGQPPAGWSEVVAHPAGGRW